MKSNVLIDTDILIEYLRGSNKIQTRDIYNGNISVITYSEILYGEIKNRRQKNTIKNLVKDLKISILEINLETIQIYTRLKIKLEKKGTKVDDFDLLIGATAISNNLQLYTNNKKHFSKIKEVKLFKY